VTEPAASPANHRDRPVPSKPASAPLARGSTPVMTASLSLPDEMSAEPDRSITVVNPATGETVDEVGVTDREQAHMIAARVAAAGRRWAATPAAERSERLRTAAGVLEAHADELAALTTAESGKLLGDARGGVMAGVGALRQYAELGTVHRGRTLHGDRGALDVMINTPRGLAAVIVPWNDPVAIAMQGAAANLAVGNAVLVKPSERAPLAVARAVELLASELPADVVRVVQGDGGTGWALVEDPAVRVVMHTGSVGTGRRIGERCGALMKKAVLELGGKDACVVDEGVDVAWAADQVALGAFANAGQICVAIERVLVHVAVGGPFVVALAERARDLKVGDPTDPETQVGPLVDAAQVRWVDQHVQDARRAGAETLAGGEPLPGPGCFYPPTVLTGVHRGMAVLRQETFGPVAPVQLVESFREGLDAANATPFGLAAVVLTPSMAHAHEAIRELQVGTVKVNAAFGGAPGGAAHPHKASGQGFGYGPELLDELTQVRVAHLEAPPPR